MLRLKKRMQNALNKHNIKNDSKLKLLGGGEEEVSFWLNYQKAKSSKLVNTIINKKNNSKKTL